jgi:hypothetical protein
MRSFMQCKQVCSPLGSHELHNIADVLSDGVRQFAIEII